MDEDKKLLKMFNEVHGEMTGSCYLEIYEDEEKGVRVMKDGNLCWGVSKTDLLFDYMTKDWEEEIDHQAIDDMNNPEYNRDDL